MEDSQIVQLYWQRSEQAVAETDAKYGKYCFSIANNILEAKEDAEEAVNDAYMGAWNSIPPHRPENLATFLGKITRRIAINKWQASRTAKRGGGETALALDELSECVPSQWDITQKIEAAELTKILNNFVRSLPDTERHIFVCRYWYLKPVDDIAKQFCFSASKVKSMLFRTRNKLRKVLEKEGIFV